MATVLPSMNSRDVCRCDQCLLVQFVPREGFSGLCRRCKLRLDYDPTPPPPEPPPALIFAESTLAEQLAANIRARRYQLGLSQREVARRLGTPRTWTSKIENLRCTPTLGSFERLANALETTIPDLLIGVDHGREEQIARLMADSLIAEIVPFLPRLGELQRRQILQCVHELSVRPKRTT